MLMNVTFRICIKTGPENVIFFLFSIERILRPYQDQIENYQSCKKFSLGKINIS
jgi:hypothetical protein